MVSLPNQHSVLEAPGPFCSGLCQLPRFPQQTGVGVWPPTEPLPEPACTRQDSPDSQPRPLPDSEIDARVVWEAARPEGGSGRQEQQPPGWRRHSHGAAG